MLYRAYLVPTLGCLLAHAQSNGPTATVNLPDYFQTKPELYPGPTPTGPAAFLAEDNPAPFEGVSYIPNNPLETQVPIQGNKDNGNIFHMHGQLSHYFPNPSGFGVDEYSLPEEASIVQLHMLHRHGARYPTTGSGAPTLATRITNATSGVSGNKVTFEGDLAFLNKWESKLGAEILVPVGKQELFDSGTLHQIMYGHLYPNDGTKMYVRSTTEDRMTQSAEYFLAGFFGLDWTNNATLTLAIEAETGIWNNTLAGYFNCNNSNTAVSQGGNNATKVWSAVYLKDATARLAKLAPGFNWTVTDSYNAQSLCAYETVALGYSQFCKLFTYDEWMGYEYSIDINFAGGAMFQSPTGRAVGVGYVQEILARLNNHFITEPTAQVNTTLDSQNATFPLGQALNFDFSHDTNIASILTAFGLKQFAQVLPDDRMENNRSLVISHVTPFAARLDMEIIETPHPLNGDRSKGDNYDMQGNTTKYIHFILNQRTLPLGKSFPECGARDDGWCDLKTFMQVQANSLQESQYNYACNGKYPAVPYGTITNGAPLTSGSNSSTGYPSGGSGSGTGAPGTAAPSGSTGSGSSSPSTNAASNFGLASIWSVLFVGMVTLMLL